MATLHKKDSRVFADPEKIISNDQIILSPSKAHGKGGFLSQVFSKNKYGKGADTVPEPQPTEAEKIRKAKLKHKSVSKRNIADGQIRLYPSTNDCVPADYNYDNRDNPFEILDTNPVRETSYIENLKKGTFSAVNGREIKRFIENQQREMEEVRPLGVENLEAELMDVSKFYEGLLAKFFRFFQGFLPGFCVIHLFLIFAGSGDQTIIQSYVLSALRVQQIMYAVGLLSVLGAFNRFLEILGKYKDAKINQPYVAENLGKQAIKYGIALISFVIVYAIIVYNRQFVAVISATGDSIQIDDFSYQFKVFKALSAIMAAFSVIGWFSLTLAFEELTPLNGGINYSGLTAEESMEESQSY